ncbi:hypothetical protein EDM57_05140 [Brevibacillus gelatini]|uniref:Uncharacterized protein n=1 Tax=Brevibacillus gelatini TaxID=1655277 RepID=A0A3M8B7X6_9BACL|nr:hypothetical protein [Brevibacillus gelatini]RNB59528.1 hypothetical protein EDM57_05140 [Brevibacillus gelatini]
MSKIKSNAKPDKITCLKCEKAKSKSNFYMNTNPLFSKSFEQLPICKSCFQNYINEGIDEQDYFFRVVLVLALLNRPMITQEWNQINRVWEKYIPPISSLPQHKGLQFKDSDFLTYDKNVQEDSLQDNMLNMNFDDSLDIREMVKYWGKGYSAEEYSYLEEEKCKLMSSFECPDYGMEMIMRDICFINLDIEKARSNPKSSTTSEISKLIETRSKLMNDAKMKPIQATGAEANDQITFGTLIKKWENDKPVPPVLDDEMKRYIDTFMVGHLAKMEGLNNELTEKYDKALAPYTIDFREINKDVDEED